MNLSLPDVEVKAAPKSVKSSTSRLTITAEQIQLRGIADISDAMRRMPGVNLRDYGGAGGLKTISVRGLGAQHTGIVYDGVVLSDCQSGQIDLSRYSLSNIKSLTLLGGDNDDIFLPAKSVASASSLLINSFSTHEVSDSTLRLDARMKFGSWAHYNPYLRVSKPVNNKVWLSANAEYIHADNDFPFTLFNGTEIQRMRREDSRMNSWHGEFNSFWQISTDKSLSSKVYYYDNTRRLPGPVVYYVSRSNEWLRERNAFSQTQFRGRLTSSLQISAIGKFSWASSHYTDTDGKYPGGRLDNHHQQREIYTSVALLYTPLQNLALDYSADWSFNNLSSNTQTAIRPYRHSFLQSIAAKYTGSRLTALVRALCSIYINNAKDGAAGKNARRISPMASVAFRLLNNKNLYIRASYKDIFRLPTFNEAYFDNYGSLNLDPENTNQTGLGLTYSESPAAWFPEITITADGYVNHTSNKIVAVPYNLHLWHMSNLGKVRTFGLDASISATFALTQGHTLMCNLSYSYQRAQIRTSSVRSDWMKQVAYTPLNSGSASLTWASPWVNLAISATGSGARFTTNYNLPETRIAGYLDCGATITGPAIKIDKCKLTPKFGLTNILDKQYEIVARYPMPGRAWHLSLNFKL